MNTNHSSSRERIVRDLLSLKVVQTIAALPRSKEEIRAYDPELDDVTSVIADACEVLAESGGVEFVVSGFVDEPWPVDVRTDLSVVLEQLPAALTRLRARKNFDINFYEQGIERELMFRVSNEPIVTVTCVSWDATWSPAVETVVVAREDLELMLFTLGTDFLTMLRMTSLELVEHELLKPWIQAVG